MLSTTIYKDDINKVLGLFEAAADFGINFDTTFRSDVGGTLKYFALYCDIAYENNEISFLYGFIQDITDASVEQEKLHELLHLAEEHIIISQTDLRGQITYVSQAFADISGYEKSELIGENHNIVRHPDMPSEVLKELWDTLKQEKSWTGDILNLNKDGKDYWVDTHITSLKNYKGEITGYQSVRQDITAKKLIEKLSITDGLTSLYNRRHFNTMLAQEINHSRRTQNRLIFAMLDVDNFKKYNDTYGHQKGDAVLINIGKSLNSSFKRAHDMVFRLGGEEFGLIFTLKEGDDAFKLVDSARQCIEDLGIEHKENVLGLVTASFGMIEVFSDFTKTIEEEMNLTYSEVDKLLYVAKENGRNNVATL